MIYFEKLQIVPLPSIHIFLYKLFCEEKYSCSKIIQFQLNHTNKNAKKIQTY